MWSGQPDLNSNYVSKWLVVCQSPGSGQTVWVSVSFMRGLQVICVTVTRLGFSLSTDISKYFHFSGWTPTYHEALHPGRCQVTGGSEAIEFRHVVGNQFCCWLINTLWVRTFVALGSKFLCDMFAATYFSKPSKYKCIMISDCDLGWTRMDSFCFQSKNVEVHTPDRQQLIFTTQARGLLTAHTQPSNNK